MPRPARFKAMETQGDPEEDFKPSETKEAPETHENEPEPLNNQEDESSSDEENVEISDPKLEVQREVARKLGWLDKDEWSKSKDPSKWTDADQFLDKTPTEIASLKERLKRLGQVNDSVMEEARRRGREEAEALLRQAKEKGDVDLAIRANKQLEQNAGPDPRVAAWVKENGWYANDVAARAVADHACDQAAKAGLSIDEQLYHAKEAVRKDGRFSNLFNKEKEPEKRQETRTAPAVQAATRSNVTPAVRKKDGWDNIPAADRQMMAKSAARMAAQFNLQPQEVRVRLAKSYWANKENK